MIAVGLLDNGKISIGEPRDDDTPGYCDFLFDRIPAILNQLT